MLPFPIKICPVEIFTRATPGSSLVNYKLCFGRKSFVITIYVVVAMFTIFQGESGRSSRKKSSHHGHRRHRPSVENDGLLPLTEESFKSLTTNEMERGLLETLMATSDSSTLKRFVQQYETQSGFVNSRSYVGL